LEAVVENLREELLVVRKRDDAVAYIAGRKHSELAPQHAGRSAFVSDGDDRREPRDRRRRIGVDVDLQAAKERRESGAAADRDDVEAVAHCGAIVRFSWGRTPSSAHAA